VGLPSPAGRRQQAFAEAEHLRGYVMEEIARVYAEALFDVARDKGKLDEIHEQLGQVAEAIADNRDLQVFLFSPYFSSSEKREGITRVVSGADPELVNFLELLAEKHRMPAIFRIRRRFDEMWAKEERRLEVKLTSAVDLPPDLVEEVGKQIEKQTGQTIELETDVDETVLGGIVLQVGNMVLDASVRNKLERLRKEVAKAA
jgi:F-type H+-transporting ATPase subunit delta